MRILLVNKYWKPVGGVEEHAFMVKRELEALGHDVIPFAMSDDENVPSPAADLFASPVDFRAGSTRERLAAVGRATFGLQTIDRISKVVDRFSIDAAHVLHAYHQLGTTFMLTLRRRGIPTVLSLHDYKLGCPNYRLFSDRTRTMCTTCLDSRFGFLWAPTAKRCWDSSAMAGAMLTAEALSTRSLKTYRRGAGAVIVLNEIQRRAVIHAGIEAERIHRIPHFVELAESSDLEREDHVLFVGRLVPEKGVDVLIRAAAAANVALRIVGDGRDRPALEQLASDLAVQAQFVGAVPASQIAVEMAKAAALAVPSLWHEVSPLVVIEAWSADLPVIGTAVGGIPDFLEGGRGFLCQPGDVAGLANLLALVARDDVAAARAASKRAREYAETELTRDRWIERLRSAYAMAGAML